MSPLELFICTIISCAPPPTHPHHIVKPRVHHAVVMPKPRPKDAPEFDPFLLPHAVPDPITAPGQPLRVSLHSPDRPRTLVVGAYTRGRVADTQRVTVAPGQAGEARLMAGADPRGRSGVASRARSTTSRTFR